MTARRPARKNGVAVARRKPEIVHGDTCVLATGDRGLCLALGERLLGRRQVPKEVASCTVRFEVDPNQSIDNELHEGCRICPDVIPLPAEVVRISRAGLLAGDGRTQNPYDLRVRCQVLIQAEFGHQTPTLPRDSLSVKGVREGLGISNLIGLMSSTFSMADVCALRLWQSFLL